MSRKVKVVIACFAVLALLATLGLGCAEEKEGEEGKVVITIGNITDITGPAGPSTKPVTWGWEDTVNYINEEDPIPGVEIRIITYDCRYDPSRDIPGYEWCKDRGAKVIYTPMPTTTAAVKVLAGRDKLPIITATASEAVVEPPGWVFAFVPTSISRIKSLLEWISAEDWDYSQGKPTIGSAGWYEPYHLDIARGVEEYCEAHSDKFEYVGSFLTPMGTVTWGGEVERLKDCDYIAIPETSLAPATFITELRSKGYTAPKLIGTDTLSGFKGLLVDKCGWESLDGMLNDYVQLWWSDPVPTMDLIKDILDRYHSTAEAQELIDSGNSYSFAVSSALFYLGILREAIENVGAENFNGQAYYETAISYETTLEGFATAGYTESIRWAIKHHRVYEWSSEARDLVRLSEWQPLVE